MQTLLIGAYGLYAVSTFFSMAPPGIAAGLLGLVILVSAVFPTKNSTTTSPPTRATKQIAIASVILAASCVLSLLGAQFFPLTIGTTQPQVLWLGHLSKLWYLLWPFVLLWGARSFSETQIQTLMRIWYYGFSFALCIGLLQMFAGFMIDGESDFTFKTLKLYPVNGLSFSYLNYPSVMTFGVFFSATEWFKPLFVAPLVSRKWLLINFIIGVVTLAGTFSRMEFIVLPVILTVFGLIQLKNWRQRCVVLGVIAVAAVFFFNLEPVKSRASYGGGIDERYQLWKINFELFKLRPWTGIGWHQNNVLSEAYYYAYNLTGPKFFSHAHSNFFDVLSTTGLIGLMAYLYWNITVMRFAFNVSAGFFIGYLSIQLNGITNVNFWEGKAMHQMMWVLFLVLVVGRVKSGRSRG